MVPSLLLRQVVAPNPNPNPTPCKLLVQMGASFLTRAFVFHIYIHTHANPKTLLTLRPWPNSQFVAPRFLVFVSWAQQSANLVHKGTQQHARKLITENQPNPNKAADTIVYWDQMGYFLKFVETFIFKVFETWLTFPLTPTNPSKFWVNLYNG
jgi:hypothetical protein